MLQLNGIPGVSSCYATMARLKGVSTSLPGVLSWNVGFKERPWCPKNGSLTASATWEKKSRHFYDLGEPSSGSMTFEQSRSSAKVPLVRSVSPVLSNTWMHRLKYYFNLGQISAEGRYGQNLCYETFEEGWHVEEGSGTLVFFFLLSLCGNTDKIHS